MSTFKPSSEISNANSWAEYREIKEGKGHDLAARHVAKTYKKAAQRGTIRNNYLPVVPYVERKAAGALDLPLRVTGPEAFQSLIRKWRPTLARTWKARLTCRSAFVHLARRRGRLMLDLLYGDGLKVNEDKQAPLEWDLVAGVEIPLADDARLAYVRPDPSAPEIVGAVQTESTGHVTPLDLLDGWGVLPIFPCFRDDVESLQPPCDRQLLDLHIAHLLQLSDIEHRRVYRTSQMWRSSDMAAEVGRHGGGDFESGADTVAELGENDRLGIVESTLKPSDDLQYVEAYLRLAAKLLDLPPEIFNSGSRAETGAAKSWDFRPLLELQQCDREAADDWLDSLVEYFRPVLVAEGVVGESEKLTVRTVAPKVGSPASVVDYANGTEKLMKLGLTSPVRELARREGIGFKEASKIVRVNIKQNRDVNIEPGESGPPAKSGGNAPAASE